VTSLDCECEVFTVKMISSSRLKPHETGWSRYMLLSPSLLRKWRSAARSNPRHPSAWLGGTWTAFDRATCNPAQGFPAQGSLGFILLVLPPYIDELLQHQVTTRSLRSTDAPRLSVPWTRTEIAKRAFCVAATNVWNSLSNDIRNASSQSTFHAKLKTHFYCCILLMNIPASASLYSLLVDIVGAIQIFFTCTLHYVILLFH